MIAGVHRQKTLACEDEIDRENTADLAASG